jgi:hypothetical protein
MTLSRLPVRMAVTALGLAGVWLYAAPQAAIPTEPKTESPYDAL